MALPATRSRRDRRRLADDLPKPGAAARNVARVVRARHGVRVVTIVRRVVKR
jgi:hypothetical protein